MIDMKNFFVRLAFFAICTVILPASAFSVNATKNKINFQSDKINAKMDESIIGSWAGKHISLEVAAQGAKIEYDCGNGVIEQKIILDKNRSFNVLGTQIEEHGGPVRQNEESAGFPVRFIGRIKGKRMTLVVKRKDNNKIIGTFSLVHGQESLLVKCR